jgi:hypothetical protein
MILVLRYSTSPSGLGECPNYSDTVMMCVQATCTEASRFIYIDLRSLKIFGEACLRGKTLVICNKPKCQHFRLDNLQTVSMNRSVCTFSFLY